MCLLPRHIRHRSPSRWIVEHERSLPCDSKRWRGLVVRAIVRSNCADPVSFVKDPPNSMCFHTDGLRVESSDRRRTPDICSGRSMAARMSPINCAPFTGTDKSSMLGPARCWGPDDVNSLMDRSEDRLSTAAEART